MNFVKFRKISNFIFYIFFLLQKTLQNARNVQIVRVRVHWEALCTNFHFPPQLCAENVCAHMWHTKGTSLKISVFVHAVCANTLVRAPHSKVSTFQRTLARLYTTSVTSYSSAQSLLRN